MRAHSLAALFGACAFVLFDDRASAHGGMYRGPADTVPPAPVNGGRGGGPSGPTTGGPSGPSAPGPSGPTTGGPRGPSTGGGGGGGGGARGPRTGGIELEPDLSTWHYWWEFNKDSYLQLKDAVHRSGPSSNRREIYLGFGSVEVDTQKPTRNQISNDVLPALARALESTDNRDITSSCLIALAKIGENHADFRLIDLLRQRLRRPDQEIRETAALAIGIAGRVDHGALDLLVGLALDDANGRAAAGGEVDTRSRAFATYGLGLVAHEHTNLAIKRAAFAAARTMLADERIGSRDLKVAAIHAIGLLNVGAASAADAALQDEALQCLVAFYERPLGAGSKLIQAHCPTAIARLLRADTTAAEPFKLRFANDLQGKNPNHRDNADIARSCAQALGQLCEPFTGDDSKDAPYSRLLAETYARHKDAQTRWFAALALGQIGGGQNRTALLLALRHGSKATERPWCALALGVLSHDHYADRASRDEEYLQDREIGRALAEELDRATDPGLVSALAIALGLNRHLDAAPAMAARMGDEVHKEDQAGYLCLGLGLMHDVKAVAAINEAMKKASRLPALLERSAIALGLLGDKTAAQTLLQRLATQENNLATFAAFATALGQIGDRRSIDPLKNLLFDEQRGNLVRAFAAVALGGIADRATLPWYAKIAANVNYRANVETLTNQNSGILDLL